jgi:hypothetical protein
LCLGLRRTNEPSSQALTSDVQSTGVGVGHALKTQLSSGSRLTNEPSSQLLMSSVQSTGTGVGTGVGVGSGVGVGDGTHVPHVTGHAPSEPSVVPVGMRSS